MTDINLIDNNWEINTNLKKIPLVNGIDQVRQRVKFALMTERGERFTDLGDGIPYFSEFLGSSPVDTKLIQQVVTSRIRKVQGVSELTDIVTSYDSENRSYNYNARIKLNNGSTLLINETI